MFIVNGVRLQFPGAISSEEKIMLNLGVDSVLVGAAEWATVKTNAFICLTVQL